MGHHNTKDTANQAKKLARYSALQDYLGKELPINAARIKFIVLLITSLIKVQSVNFERLAQPFIKPKYETPQ